MIVTRAGIRAVEHNHGVARSIHRPYLNRPLLTAIWLYVGLAVIRIAGAVQDVFLVGALAVTPAALAAVPRQQWRTVGVCRPRSWSSLLLGVAVTVVPETVFYRRFCTPSWNCGSNPGLPFWPPQLAGPWPTWVTTGPTRSTPLLWLLCCRRC